MRYNSLGRSGLKISEVGFGSWLTFGDDLDVKKSRAIMRKAIDLGINFFDNAEAYGNGESEKIMGEALKGIRREDLVISTKLIRVGDGPNDSGLSWKHLVEGTKNSLKRLQMDYVDLLFCHRPDPSTPIEETVRAMDYLIRSGYVFYWGTSEWSADQIESAYVTAKECNCIPPTMEQPQYNMLERKKMEDDYVPIFRKWGMGTTTFSPLASGVLTGKYLKGIPKGSRLDKVEWLRDRMPPNINAIVSDLIDVANDLECSPCQLAIGWCLRNQYVSSVILGATSIEQLTENVNSINLRQKLSEALMQRIETILKNKP